MGAVTVVDRGWNRIKKNNAALMNMGVKVGIQDDAGDNPKTGEPIVEYAVKNEFGWIDPNGTIIPSRPFMRSMADARSTATVLTNMSKLEYGTMLDGRQTVTRMLEHIGEWYANAQEDFILKGPWAPNAPSTIKRKGSSKPLVDTFAMIDEIVAKVVYGRGSMS